MNGVQKRKQITHGYGFDLHIRQALHGRTDLGFCQGFDDLTGVINPLGHAETPATRDDLIWGREVNIKSRFFIVATDLYGIAKAGGGDQPGSGAGIFQHGVGGDRCAMDNNRYPAEKILLGQSIFAGQFADAVENAQGLILSGRQDFLGLRLSGLVRTHQVGEGPADIDA